MDMARSPRLKTHMDQRAAHFTASVSFDWRLLPFDVEGSIAHVTMLSEQGVIAHDAAETIISGLKQVLEEWQTARLSPRLEWEDVHMNVEGRLNELIGPVSGMLHTARSRNDQVALDMHLYMLDVGSRLKAALHDMIASLVERARNDLDVIIPGYTHMQPAQPVLLSHHWMAYKSMFVRDYERLEQWHERTNCSPLGAGALSGTPYPTSPERTRELLALKSVYDNSIDAVSDRDFLMEFLSWASLVMVHMSRLAEELVIWSTQEFGYIRIADEYSTGSSIMPQKRNADVAELTRGKTGRVLGRMQGLFTTMKGLPLAYDSDMQEDKEAVFDVVDTMTGILAVVPGMLRTLSVQRGQIKKRLGQDFTAATDLADLLVTHGMTFREAHHLVGRIVGFLEGSGKSFQEMERDWLKEIAPAVDPEWLNHLTAADLVIKRQQSMATAPHRVQEQLEAAETWLNRHNHATKDESRP